MKSSQHLDNVPSSGLENISLGYADFGTCKSICQESLFGSLMNGCINSLQYGIVFLIARCNNQKSVRNIFEQSYSLQGLSIIEYCQVDQVQLPFVSSETSF